MPRFFLSGGSSIAGGTAFILGEDAAHAKVLRLRIGDTMIVCDGGKDHHCTVTKITPNEVEAEIFEVVPCQGEPSVHTVILAGLPKGSDKTDYILQNCTEAGASEIYFFASSRCVARIQGDADKKIARWQRIAEEAAKQSGRGVIPTVGFLPDLAEAFNKANATALPLFMHETGERETLRDCAGRRALGAYVRHRQYVKNSFHFSVYFIESPVKKHCFFAGVLLQYVPSRTFVVNSRTFDQSEKEGDAVKVAVLGYGTVGAGVYSMLSDAPGMEAGPVLVRPGKAVESFMVSDAALIFGDPTVDAVVETLGGLDPAYSYGMRALEAGKHFITANKAMVAAHGLELAALAREKGAAFLFSAACGGGVPFLHNLALSAETDRIEAVSGILNGTTNYMLDAMQRRSLSYGDALREAQSLGYAESDPTADVSGLDALRKMQLACAVAFGVLPQSGMLCEGMEHFTAADVEDIQSRGLVCRLMARGSRAGESVSAYVEPVLFPRAAPESSVFTNNNMARYTGKRCGSIVLMGQGAGRFPTASAVLRDLSAAQQGARSMFPENCRAAEADNREAVHSYYIRTGGFAAVRLSLRSVLAQGEVVRAVTEPMSAEKMHALAQNIRKDGNDLFFAALEEELC